MSDCQLDWIAVMDSIRNTVRVTAARHISAAGIFNALFSGSY